MEKDPNLIYPGDPRHPCLACSGRRPEPGEIVFMHFMPCEPVPLDQAHKPAEPTQ